MRPIALDTNAYSAFRRGDEVVLAVVQHASELMMCTVVIGELRSGCVLGDFLP